MSIPDGLPINTSTAILSVYDRIRGYFQPLKPEARTMTLDYSNKTARMKFRIDVPDGKQKTLIKIKIPAHEGYRIINMMDSGFVEHTQTWKKDGGFFVLDAKHLPVSGPYLVETEGTVDENIFKKLIYIQPSTNRNATAETDSYWLESSIKSAREFESIYSELEIEKINFGVKVDIEKIFKLSIPKEMIEFSDTTVKLLNALTENDRNKVHKLRLIYKQQQREYKHFNPNDLVKIIMHFTANEMIREHIKIDKPYDFGGVTQPERYVGPIPQSVQVEAVTKLTLKNPVASGFLTFYKQKYLEKLKQEFKNFSNRS